MAMEDSISAISLGQVSTEFWGRLIRTASGCWEWPGVSGTQEYGNMGIDGVLCYSHRIAYLLANGPIPEGLFVLHRCDNPPCCNPGHLFIGTQKANMEDMFAKGRGRRAIGERHPHAKLSDAQVAEIRDRHARGGISIAQLAREYGINCGHASRLISRKKRKT